MVNGLIKVFYYVVLILFFVLCAFICAYNLVLFLANLNLSMYRVFFAIVFIFIGLLSYFKTRLTLYLFIASIPLLYGMQKYVFNFPLPLLQAVFSVIFLGWSVKFYKIGNYEYLIKCYCLKISLLFVLLVLFSITYVLHQNLSSPLIVGLSNLAYPNINDPLFSLTSGSLMLSGILFFMMMRIEFSCGISSRCLINLLLFHSLIIAAFGVMQIVLKFPLQDIPGVSVYSPFDDKHSYGSYVALLFVFFFHLSFSRVNVSYKYLCVSLVLFCLVVLSFSRMTMVAVIVVVLFYLFMILKLKYKMIVVLVLVAGIGIVNINFSKISKDSLLLHRYANVVSIDNIVKDCNFISRMIFWKRAINIVTHHPFFGIGVGRYFTASIAYNDSFSSNIAENTDCSGYINYKENTHNYFLQLVAEMGVPTFIVFVIMLFSFVSCKFPFCKCSYVRNNGFIHLTYGLVAYILTWLTGHPLLLIVQQLLFWGLVALLPVVSDDCKSYWAGDNPALVKPLIS